jgi:hypothetical protein
MKGAQGRKRPPREQPMTDDPRESNRLWLLYKYAHVGCPAARYEDNCTHPDRCADNGGCLGLSVGALGFGPPD